MLFSDSVDNDNNYNDDKSYKISMIIMLVTMILIIITVLGSIVLHTQNLLFICSPFEVCIKISKSSQA